MDVKQGYRFVNLMHSSANVPLLFCSCIANYRQCIAREGWLCTAVLVLEDISEENELRWPCYICGLHGLH